MKRIGRGRTADIFEHPDNDKWVIKLCHPHIPASDVQREFQIAQLAFSLGVPTPEPVEILQMDGRMGIVFERATGEPLLKQLMARPMMAREHARKLAVLHHSLHVHEIGGQLPEQKDILRRNIQAADVLTDQEKETVLRCLEKLPGENRLCHGDFHPDNVMTGEKDCILDWVNGMRGHPAGDVARSIVLLSVGAVPPGTPGDVEAQINSIRKNFTDQYLKEYRNRTGMDIAEIEKWLLPVTAARLNEHVPDAEQKQLLDFIRTKVR